VSAEIAAVDKAFTAVANHTHKRTLPGVKPHVSFERRSFGELAGAHLTRIGFASSVRRDFLWP